MNIYDGMRRSSGHTADDGYGHSSEIDCLLVGID